MVKYQVWRLAAGDEYFVKVVEENQAATSHAATGLGQGTTYSYQVFIGVTGNWGLPALIQVSTPAGTPQPTATPDPALQPHRAQNLTATPTSNTVTLTWENPAAHEIVKHRVSRKTPGELLYTDIHTEETADTSHVDTGLEAGTAYQYLVTVGKQGDWGNPVRVETTTLE